MHEDFIDACLKMGFCASAGWAGIPILNRLINFTFSHGEVIPWDVSHAICAVIAALFLGVIILRRREITKEE